MSDHRTKPASRAPMMPDAPAGKTGMIGGKIEGVPTPENKGRYAPLPEITAAARVAAVGKRPR